jgi:hypothetical protein
MGGRMRELCAGVNVDLGTAAAFREQWAREAGAPPSAGSPTPLLLRTDQAPGDAVVMTAAIYSLHRAYPSKYATAVESLWPDVFANNPDVSPPTSGAAELHMHYPAIHLSNGRGVHFMQGWCEFLGAALGCYVPLLTNRPHLYFPDSAPPPVGDFWLICSGGKRDFTNKLWGWHAYQEVVDRLAERVRFVQVGDAAGDHPRLVGAEDMIGRTTLRGLFYLARRARGVLCGVSLLMHVAAALEKPAVVVAGGREPVQWNAYPRQQYLHTVGALPCRDLQGRVGGACWRSRVIPLGDGTAFDRDICERPIHGPLGQFVPQCMTLIQPAEVADYVLRCDRGYN